MYKYTNVTVNPLVSDLFDSSNAIECGVKKMRKGMVIEDALGDRSRLTFLLQQAFPKIIIHNYSSRKNALQAILTDRYNIVLLDIVFQSGLGTELIIKIKECSPETVIVVCSQFDDDQHLTNAFQAGADGYLLKDLSKSIFVQKLQGIPNGDPPLSPGITRKLLRHYSNRSQVFGQQPKRELSPRETEILTCVAKGFSRKEIAKMLNLSSNTVAGYIRDIYRTLNISCKAEAAVHACRMGLIDPNVIH